MTALLGVGRVLFAAAVVGLGVQSILRGDVVPGLEPLSPTVAGRVIWVHASALVLVAAGGAILVDRVARFGALAVAGLLFLWVLILHLPLLLADPKNGSEWTCALESLAIGGAAWALAGMLAPQRPGSSTWDRLAVPGVRLGRLGYALSLPGFGILHFVYAEYVSAAIPAWIPGHLFWTYATGVGHIAGGLSILTGKLARLGATLLAIMFGSWVVVLHMPRVVAQLRNPNEWASLLIALAMSGGAAIVAATFARSEPAA